MFFETTRQSTYSHVPDLSQTDKPPLPPLNTMTTTMSVPQFNPASATYTLNHTVPQPHSPIYSPSTPNSPSHTAPQYPLMYTQQIQKNRGVSYIPAVLRPTEWGPKRCAKPSPPLSANGSFDSLDGELPQRRDSTDSGKFTLGAIEEIEGDFDIGDLPDVTGTSVTKTHWKPDSASRICDEPTCTRPFSTFHRRHHCRKCGYIFCDTHSSFSIPLNEDATYHPQGHISRACGHCFKDYRRWSIARSSRSNSETSDDAPATPVIDCRSGRVVGAGTQNKGVKGLSESVAASVPRDWNWSTF